MPTIPYHEEDYKGYHIEIHTDDSPHDPRDDDNLGTMVCFHNRYGLGDEKHGYTSDDQGSWQELADRLVKDGAALILPLYLYDHSGITMSTGKFDCPWDSGQVGFIFVTKAKLLKEYGGKRITKKTIATATRVLEGEVKTYDDYLTGNVYGYRIEDPAGNDFDSCWGYFGDYDDKDYGALHEAKSCVDYHFKHLAKVAKEVAKAVDTINEPLIIRRNPICQ
jgi:hypothetical protein